MPRSTYTNPIENIRAYIMVKAGFQKDERLADLEWMEDKIKAGDRLAIRANEILRRIPADTIESDENRSALELAIKEWKELG